MMAMVMVMVMVPPPGLRVPSLPPGHNLAFAAAEEQQQHLHQP
jgi:hypothetical protein